MKASLVTSFVDADLEEALEGVTPKLASTSMGGFIAPHNTPDVSGVNTPSGVSTPTVTKSPQTSGFLNTVKERLGALASERSADHEEPKEQEYVKEANQDMGQLELEWSASELQYALSRKELESQRLHKWEHHFKPRFAKIRAKQEGDVNYLLKDLLNNDMLREVIKTHDIPALKCLYNVAIDLPLGKDIGFTLTFSFHTNPFFTNTSLQKTFIVPNLYEEVSEPEVQVENGTPVSWKKPLVVDSQGKPQQSFFNIFNPLWKANQEGTQKLTNFRICQEVRRSILPNMNH